ncbi:hypothetical protein CK203_115962 [Vitis vinifera]|uniref:Uncharacterized protein n=1 Tax=Vitis vinifera TaxID=29760 RepID=A0A438FDM8_VITVI|nr:hypothetical protein CK203_115962 [Vitis vinifera]
MLHETRKLREENDVLRIQEVQLEEKFPPTCPTLLDESSDSTRISTKKRRDKRSQLSNAMRTWLGPPDTWHEGKTACSNNPGGLPWSLSYSGHARLASPSTNTTICKASDRARSAWLC